MKRLTILLLALFVAAATVGLYSCKKQGLETPFTRMFGKWKKVKYATDDNRNGVIDPKEIMVVESSVKNELLFKPDSTGVESSTSSPDLSFKWKIYDGTSVLIQYSANDTITYSISNISSVDLTLTTMTKLGLAWYYYIKE